MWMVKAVWFTPYLLSSPWQVYKDSILGAWQKSVIGDLCKRGRAVGVSLEGFLCMIEWVLQQLLFSSHVRDRDRAPPGATPAGGLWNGFLLGNMRVLRRFCGGTNGDGHLFLGLLVSPLGSSS